MKGSHHVIDELDELIRRYGLEDEVELKASFCMDQCTGNIGARVDDGRSMISEKIMWRKYSGARFSETAETPQSGEESSGGYKIKKADGTGPEGGSRKETARDCPGRSRI